MKTHEILLIDDDPMTNFINNTVIKSEFPNYSPVIFENGPDALAYIRENPKSFYLIFLDINMPVMDGWEFLETLSKDTSQYNLVIHILSSSLDSLDKRKADKSNLVTSFLTKPLKKDVLKELKLGL
ncbi:response regulator [Arenibacter aquaticus]|uniref:Response regulator n=1 Tax=Arenibacter aquaticus TaxID=2489054 RepID=A0A3S0ABU9_9FLAO|nr:response regulator [Arenibacter aquaticus]RTE51852.1 response regulator [Arenibacter aquaticus]